MKINSSPSHNVRVSGFDQAREALLRVVDIARLHLAPNVLSQSIAAKAKRHLKALEAYVRRLILFMALQMEASLKLDMSEYTPQHKDDKPRTSTRSFRFLETPRRPADVPDLRQYAPRPTGPVKAAPIIGRVQTLQAILDAPEAFAHRLACRLARQPKDQCPVLPGIYQSVTLLGTEAATQHHALTDPLFTALMNRPPRAGPRPRSPPRIRQL